ncbi:hypothetical protein ACF0H5_014519 [Mactra antiquata]
MDIDLDTQEMKNQNSNYFESLIFSWKDMYIKSGILTKCKRSYEGGYSRKSHDRQTIRKCDNQVLQKEAMAVNGSITDNGVIVMLWRDIKLSGVCSAKFCCPLCHNCINGRERRQENAIRSETWYIQGYLE